MKRKILTVGKMNGSALTHMRDVVYGRGMQKHIRDVCKASETMRDDEALLSAAEQKRLRKQQKRMGRK